MFYRRVAIPVVLLITLLLQFLPGTPLAPRPVAAVSCDAAQFIADVTIPDGTVVSPGATFVKTWRLKNVGSCTWTTAYAIVFTGGDQLGAPAVVNMPSSVAPNGSVDITVNMTAPTAPGHYRGNWKLRNATGSLFGVGAGNYLFWVDIFVNTSYTTNYDFIANAGSAAWSSGAGALPFPGTDGNAGGFVLPASNPQLENGTASSSPGLIVNPQNVAGGYIQGIFPAFTVQAGDRFQSLVNCAYNSPNCYVNFRLNYQIGSGAVQNLWSFNERYEGLFYRVNLDLGSLAGQNVKFILYVADVSGHGTPAGDRAEWVETRIARAGGGVPPIPPSPTCDKGAFVADVTIPDGSTVAASSAFTKTWRIKNVGSCTWTTAYALAFVMGDPFGAASIINLPASVAPVAPGETKDFSINMVAPSVPGHYRSYWRFRNASGTQFGVGSGMITFFADINVVGGGVGPNPSTTTILADTPDASSPGQAVLVSASVTGAGITPTGTVTITGADTICTISLSGGSGSCNVVFNTAGAKVLSAVYSGDFAYATSSDTENHTVNKGASTTTITADTPDPSLPSGAVSVSVSVSGAGVTPTGTVAITGADTNCTITLSGGTGSCGVVFNTMGAKVLTATYNGDLNYNASTDTENHNVSTATNASTTTITADTPDPSVPGGVVAVNVSVIGSGTIPTGTVAITGADSNCTVTLAGGVGSCNVIFNTAGAKTLTGTYSGNANYLGSSDTESHTVSTGLAASTTTITSTVPNPSTPGQAVVVNVSVNGAGLPVPTGTVNITGADTNCNVLLAGGTGSCTIVFNSTGHKNITASYGGDGHYAASTGTFSHTVTKGSTTTTITSDTPDPSVPGQAVTVSFTVSGAGYTPTGTVDITGADINCSIALSGGSGSCAVVFNTWGAKTLTATYSGDVNYLSSTDTEPHIVKNLTTTTITSTVPNPSIPGQAVLVNVTVLGDGVTVPTGNVTITGSDDVGATICPLNASGMTVGCAVTFTSAGARTLTATYAGDGNYVGSSGSASHNVSKGTPTAFLITADAPDPSLANVSVTVTVVIAGAGVIPTGTVGISLSGGQASTCTITLVGGTGSCNVSFTTPGSYTITATYSGDGNYIIVTDTEAHTVN